MSPQDADYRFEKGKPGLFGASIPPRNADYKAINDWIINWHIDNGFETAVYERMMKYAPRWNGKDLYDPAVTFQKLGEDCTTYGYTFQWAARLVQEILNLIRTKGEGVPPMPVRQPPYIPAEFAPFPARLKTDRRFIENIPSPEDPKEKVWQWLDSWFKGCDFNFVPYATKLEYTVIYHTIGELRWDGLDVIRLTKQDIIDSPLGWDLQAPYVDAIARDIKEAQDYLRSKMTRTNWWILQNLQANDHSEPGVPW